MGPEFEIEKQLAIFIAMVMVIVSLTSSMPLLNLCGALICFIMYWTDKALVLKLAKNPPPYTKEMIMQVINIMEWAVPLHLIFGLFMMTNPNTFAYTPEVEYGRARFATRMGKFLSQYFMIDSDRFYLPHSSLYAVSVFMILALFLLDKLTDWCIFRDGTGFFQRLVLLPTGYLFVKCSGNTKHKISTNLYSEISAEALEKEYKETETVYGQKTVELTTRSA
jgi:hypothetical protein